LRDINPSELDADPSPSSWLLNNKVLMIRIEKFHQVEDQRTLVIMISWISLEVLNHLEIKISPKLEIAVVLTFLIWEAATATKIKTKTKIIRNLVALVGETLITGTIIVVVATKTITTTAIIIPTAAKRRTEEVSIGDLLWTITTPKAQETFLTL